MTLLDSYALPPGAEVINPICPFPPSDTDPRVLEKQEQQQPTYLALSYINRFMTDAARREQETMKKKATPKLSLSITGGMSRNSTATPPRHTSGNLTPPVTPPITPSSSFRSSTPTGTARALGRKDKPVAWK
ncbi:Juxtaposed with another zinc finger protein 1 [Goodea atripinnis]|uniref:Juxtaposed with another zinc finger protein 1 n=1 Tax=Goodea atripinnis TaxID=208336 RepID=A0ABV0MQW1_9TELE